MKNIRTSFQLGILVLLVIIAGQCSAANLTKEHFLRQADRIDAATAKAMAENLTDADWYEIDPASLMDAFQATLDARKRFEWGSKVPEDVYRRYVVPLRVGSEPLQPFRRKFLNEIGPRLDSLHSLARAALEVNLYLGERVGFKSTDKRSQGPLTTLSCGFGRCGELMILAIDAMRSVGIPARGVWVPWFSARENNHAWIEVYTENGWKYMGGAEPAVRLNQAWFDKPVQRAGIVLTMDWNHKKNEQYAVKNRGGYSLNVIRNYMTPAKLSVQMPEDWNKEDHLWLAVFNFGSLRPLAELQPKSGIASLAIGAGDFVLMGVHQGKLFFQKVTARLNQETRVRMDVSQRAPQDFTLTYPWPPESGRKEPELLAKSRIDHAHLLKKERDKKRYETGRRVEGLISRITGNRKKLLDILRRSPGNEATVLNAVLGVPQKQQDRAIFTLSLLSDKDLREVRPDVLSRWLQRTPGRYADNEELKEFVLNPQVGFEYSGTGLPSKYASKPLQFSSLTELRTKIAKYASLVDSALAERPLPPVTIDHLLTGAMPVSVTNAAIWWTDRMRRSGIPARREPFSEWLEFFFAGKWLPLFPDRPEKLGDRNALPNVKAHYESPVKVKLQWKGKAAAPKWKSDFLFLPLKKDGVPDYWRDVPKDLGQDGKHTTVTLDPGNYLFTCARRNKRGDVSVQVRVLELKPGEKRAMPLDLLPPVVPPN